MSCHELDATTPTLPTAVRCGANRHPGVKALRLSLPRKELDGLANRRRVLAVLAGVGEEDVAEPLNEARGRRVTVTGRLVRLVRPGG
jgi:hypothetical protein